MPSILGQQIETCYTQSEFTTLGELSKESASFNKLILAHVGAQLHNSLRHVVHSIFDESEDVRLVLPVNQKADIFPNILDQLGKEDFGLFVSQGSHSTPTFVINVENQNDIDFEVRWSKSEKSQNIESPPDSTVSDFGELAKHSECRDTNTQLTRDNIDQYNIEDHWRKSLPCQPQTLNRPMARHHYEQHWNAIEIAITAIKQRFKTIRSSQATVPKEHQYN